MRQELHILGLCPLLAVSHKLVYGLCLGLCTMAVMVASALIGPAVAARFPSSVRLVVHMLVIGALVIAVELLLLAHFHSLYDILGLFVPLIITNCAILAHCEHTAMRRPGIGANLAGSVRVGAAFVAVLACVSALREVFGHGTLLDDIELFAGAGSEALTLSAEALYGGVPIALLPCGAFFALAIVVAAINARAQRTGAGAPVDEVAMRYHARR